jgi:hypothetical protein
MFRLFPSHHQGACYMVQRKNNFPRYSYLHYVFFSSNLPCVKIINKILKTFCCLTLLCVVVCVSRGSWLYHLKQGCTNPGCHITKATKFCMVVLNVCWSSAWNLFHVTLLTVQISRWILQFLENLCTSDLKHQLPNCSP